MSLVKNKSGALELSIGTIVIIVIGMSMLILGLVLVKTIFTGSTDSINILNEGVQAEIVSLFAAEGSDVVVKLGSDRTLTVKKGEWSNVGFGAKPSSGASIDGGNHLKYKISLAETTGKDCIKINGQRNTEDMILTPLDSYREFGTFDPNRALGEVKIEVPEQLTECTQEVYIEVKDTLENSVVGRANFYIKVISGGIF
tara:strand:+ start:110 stop:706 length:597 start_codon:yes stop_codon:yes gene_type:complete